MPSRCCFMLLNSVFLQNVFLLHMCCLCCEHRQSPSERRKAGSPSYCEKKATDMTACFSYQHSNFGGQSWACAFSAVHLSACQDVCVNVFTHIPSPLDHHLCCMVLLSLVAAQQAKKKERKKIERPEKKVKHMDRWSPASRSEKRRSHSMFMSVLLRNVCLCL